MGSQTKYVRGASPAIDYATEAASLAVHGEKPTATSEAVKAYITEEDRRSLLEDPEYWEGKAPGDVIRELAREPVGEQLDDFEEAHIFHFQFDRGNGGRSPDFAKVINKGLNGVLSEIREEIKGRLVRPGELGKIRVPKGGDYLLRGGNQFCSQVC